MMDEEIRQALCEVREMKQMCGNINMKLTNIVTQRGQDWKKKLEAEYQRGLEDGKQTAVGAAELREKLEYQKGFNDGKAQVERGCEGCEYEHRGDMGTPCEYCSKNFKNLWRAKEDKIEVGDEVETKDGKRFVVTTFGSSLNGDIAVGVCADGFGLGVDLKELRKTGRHFDIASILEAMKA